MSTWTGAVSTDWNNAGNWAAGGTGTGIPSATVDAIFSGTPTRPCVLGANRTCRALTFTGYTSTVDLATFTLTANNNITFQSDQSSRILGSTGILISGASSTITSNSGIWPLNYQISNVVGITITLADDMRIAGSYSSSGGTRTINGNNIYVGTNVTSSATHGGTTNLIMNGSGTYSGTNAFNLEINTTGTIIITGSVAFTRRFIVTAVGSLTMTAANVSIQNTTTIDLGGRQIGTLSHTFTIGSTITYLSDVYCSNFTIGNGTNVYNGPGKIFASGNYTLSGGTSSGSLVIELTGNGSISTGTMGLACIINSSGTYTLGITLTLANNFTYSGGILNVGTSTVTTSGNIIIISNGINWYNMVIPTGTITLNNLMTVINNLTLASSANITFTGSAGWTCVNLLCSTAGRTITLANSSSGASYKTTNNAQLTATAASPTTMVSNNATTQSIWTLDNGALQSLVYINGTRIDSSQGQTIWSFGATLNGTTNWATGSRPGTVAYTFVN